MKEMVFGMTPAAVLFVLMTFVTAPAQEPFYKGKTLRIVVATSAAVSAPGPPPNRTAQGTR